MLVEVTDGTCGRCLAGQGAILTLEEIVARDLLPPLHPNCRCTIAPWSAPPTEEGGAWYDPILRIPDDLRKMLDTFAASQQERLGRGTLGGALDYLTLGMVSGFGRGLRERWDTARREPSLYSIANWLSLGFADEVKGSVSPKEPLSLEHWLHSLAVAGTLAGAYETVKPRSLHPTSTAELRAAARRAGDAPAGARSVEGEKSSLYDVNGEYTGGRTSAELKSLAEDPAHAGSKRQIDMDKGLHEREVGLGVEESGKIKGPITRDPSGKAEFFDANRQA